MSYELIDMMKQVGPDLGFIFISLCRLFVCVKGGSQSSFIYCISEVNIPNNIYSGHAAAHSPLEVVLAESSSVSKPDNTLKKVQEHVQVLRDTCLLMTM